MRALSDTDAQSLESAGNWELDGGTLLCRAHFSARRAGTLMEAQRQSQRQAETETS